MSVRFEADGMLATLRYYFQGVLRHLGKKEVFLWAEAIAFKVLIALVPVVLLVTGIFGRVLRSEKPFRYVDSIIRDLMPAYGSDRLIEFLGQLREASTALTIIGAIGFLFTATTLFSTLRTVLANIFREDWHQARSFLRGLLFDLRMAVQVGLFLVLSIAVTVLVQALGPAGIAMAVDVGLDPGRLKTAWEFLVHVFSMAVPFVLSVGMFFQLFFFTPLPRPPKRSALAGAVVGAVLWEAVKSLFTLYATHVMGFDKGFLAVLGDTFVLIILVVFWAYYSGLVLCIGAIVTLLYHAAHRTRQLEADAARAAEALHPSSSAPSAPVALHPSPDPPFAEAAVRSLPDDPIAAGALPSMTDAPLTPEAPPDASV